MEAAAGVDRPSCQYLAQYHQTEVFLDDLAIGLSHKVVVEPPSAGYFVACECRKKKQLWFFLSSRNMHNRRCRHPVIQFGIDTRAEIRLHIGSTSMGVWSTVAIGQRWFLLLESAR